LSIQKKEGREQAVAESDSGDGYLYELQARAVEVVIFFSGPANRRCPGIDREGALDGDLLPFGEKIEYIQSQAGQAEIDGNAFMNDLITRLRPHDILDRCGEIITHISS
jgi:hypothetical protein